MSVLYNLTYCSRNNIEALGGTLATEISQILNKARLKNKRQGLTGALLFSGGCFAQVLEGPLDAIETIFEQIQCDERHRDVTVLNFKPVDHRSFGDWSMAYAGVFDDDRKIFDFEGMVSNSAAIESGESGRDMVAILADLISRSDASTPDETSLRD